MPAELSDNFLISKATINEETPDATQITQSIDANIGGKLTAVLSQLVIDSNKHSSDIQLLLKHHDEARERSEAEAGMRKQLIERMDGFVCAIHCLKRHVSVQPVGVRTYQSSAGRLQRK